MSMPNVKLLLYLNFVGAYCFNYVYRELLNIQVLICAINNWNDTFIMGNSMWVMCMGCEAEWYGIFWKQLLKAF